MHTMRIKLVIPIAGSSSLAALAATKILAKDFSGRQHSAQFNFTAIPAVAYLKAILPNKTFAALSFELGANTETKA